VENAREDADDVLRRDLTTMPAVGKTLKLKICAKDRQKGN
jgi:hypothetical protein